MSGRIGFGLVFFGLLVGLVGVGCGGGAAKGPALVEVKGKVELDGKAMNDGEAMFLLPGQVPDTFPVKGGSFAGKAKVGKAKVEIRAYRPGKPNPMYPDKEPSPENYLPAKYNTESTLTADVSASGANDFKFEVKSR